MCTPGSNPQAFRSTYPYAADAWRHANRRNDGSLICILVPRSQSLSNALSNNRSNTSGPRRRCLRPRLFSSASNARPIEAHASTASGGASCRAMDVRPRRSRLVSACVAAISVRWRSRICCPYGCPAIAEFGSGDARHYSIHSYATMRSNNRRGRVRQLACCKTLANRANAAQSIACGSLQTSLVQQGFCKDLLFRPQPAKRVDFDGAALPDPDWRGEAKNSICRREGKPKKASVDAWDDASSA